MQLSNPFGKKKPKPKIDQLAADINNAAQQQVAASQRTQDLAQQLLTELLKENDTLRGRSKPHD